jgi:hypothetical protein
MNYDLPNLNSEVELSDWIEWFVITTENQVSKSKLLKILSEHGSDNIDDRLDAAIAELERREYYFGNNWYISVQSNVIKSKVQSWEEIVYYTFCLYFSLFGAQTRKNEDNGTKLFERLSIEVILNYLEGDGLLLGFPSKTSLDQQIEDIAYRTNEKRGTRKPLSTDKDKGVDIVAWKSFDDKRNCQLVLLIQVAAGLHWNNKKQISRTAWREFINWSIDPITGIITPNVLNELKWTNARDDYGLIFDRIRIFKSMLKNNMKDKRLIDEIKEWIISKQPFLCTTKSSH